MALAEDMNERFLRLAAIARDEPDKDIYLQQVVGLLGESVIELAAEVDALKRQLAERADD